MCAVLLCWRYNCIDGTKRAVNACMGLYCSRAKEKPRQRGRGGNYLLFSSRSARAAQSSCVSSSVKSYSVRSWSASALLHPPSYRAAALLETSFNMVFLFSGLLPFFIVYHIASPKNRTCRKFLPFWAGAGLLYGAAPLKCPGGITWTF
nr:MAG TPA: hypothetical protein [Caudoviricetes sp.]